MDKAIFGSIPGGQALMEWFGRVPRFHDAELLDISLASKGPSVLRIHTWRMTDKIDDQGYYVLDKHVTVTVTLSGVTYVALNNFNLQGIIADLEVTKAEREFQLAWTGSYGIEGTLRAEQMRIDLKPGEP